MLIAFCDADEHDDDDGPIIIIHFKTTDPGSERASKVVTLFFHSVLTCTVRERERDGERKNEFSLSRQTIIHAD